MLGAHAFHKSRSCSRYPNVVRLGSCDTLIQHHSSIKLITEAAAAQGESFGLPALGWANVRDGIDLPTQADTLGHAGVQEWAPLPPMDM